MKKLKIERRIVGKKWYHGNEVINQADPPITKKVTNVVHTNMSFTEASYAWEEDLEEAITPFIGREFSTLDPVERAILRLGVYELMHRQDVPTKVVLNEMIELAKVFGSDHSYKFINGVMDKLAKNLR